MNVKYQIFVSSTYEDLRDERDQVVKAILEMGHIPVGMEMFSAADEEQWRVITHTIDEVDYYVVIIAHRYGSTVGGVSYTEKEYDYAVSKGVPTLGFVIENSARWPRNRVDTNAKATAALKRFRGKVSKKFVSSWVSAEDLHGKVSIALMKQMNTNPRTGWVRATEVIPPTLTVELSRLSSENASLRSQLAQAVSQAAEEETEQRERTLAILQKNEVDVLFFYANGRGWEDRTPVPLFDIFYMLAPKLLIEISTAETAELLGVLLNESGKRLRSRYPVPSNAVTSWIADFVTLELVEPSKKKHQVKDTKEYWTLTRRGRDLLRAMNRARLDSGTEADTERGTTTAETAPRKRTGRKTARKKRPQKRKKN